MWHHSHSVKELLKKAFCIFSLEHDKKPQSASGGKKPSGKGSDSAKDNPRSHPSSGKPTGPHPRPHKNK